VKVPGVQDEQSSNDSSISLLSKRLSEVEKLNQELLRQLQEATSSKGKGRGKSSHRAPELRPSTSASQFVEFFEGQSTHSNSTSSVYSENVSEGEKTVYIKKIQLFLNGAPIDQVSSVLIHLCYLFHIFRVSNNILFAVGRSSKL